MSGLSRNSSTTEPADHLIRKGSLYYRPECRGYTSDPTNAGRYSKSFAEREAGIEPWHMEAIPMASVLLPASDIHALLAEDADEVLTAYQVDLARHALGLPNGGRRSCRNRFVAGLGHPDYDDWHKMTLAGFATKRNGTKLPFGGNDLFHLTRKGAEAALVGRETLDPEDFPS